MNDIEQRLRRYRPVGPPRELRVRALEIQPRVARAWPWAAAAAALLAMTIGFQVAAVRPHDAMAGPHASVEREAAIEELTNMLGGGDEARTAAERAIAMQEADWLLRSERQPVGTTGESR
jgi:hypothetical protein